MAEPFDFSDQRPGAVPPDQREELMGQWASFLDKPGARSALLGFGINLLQPPSFGDTGASQIGRAIGAGAESAGRGELQEAKVGELEARSSAAGARAGQAESRLGLEYFRRKSVEEVAKANRESGAFRTYIKDQADTQKAYQRQKADIDKANVVLPASKQQPYPPPPPPMDFPTWMRVRGAGLIGAGQTNEPAAPPRTGELEGD